MTFASLFIAILLAWPGPPADGGDVASCLHESDWQPLALVSNHRDPPPATARADQPAELPLLVEPDWDFAQYREVSDFFNIREANPNVIGGEWEFQVPAAWTTRSAGGDDDFNLAGTLKFGVTDDLFVEIGVLPVNVGDGGDQGNGDMTITLFERLVQEVEDRPSLAAWASMRVPTGEGSSGVDGELHLAMTKTLVPSVRVHLEGFVQTANGGRGDADDDQRHFQWGLGPGIDYRFDETTIGVLNYLHRASERQGEGDRNVLEVGLARELRPGQTLKAAVDIGMDGQGDTPNFAAKILWSLKL